MPKEKSSMPKKKNNPTEYDITSVYVYYVKCKVLNLAVYFNNCLLAEKVFYWREKCFQ